MLSKPLRRGPDVSLNEFGFFARYVMVRGAKEAAFGISAPLLRKQGDCVAVCYGSRLANRLLRDPSSKCRRQVTSCTQRPIVDLPGTRIGLHDVKPAGGF